MVTLAGLKRRVDTAATEIRYAWRAGLLGRQVDVLEKAKPDPVNRSE
jgi:hypothetical protein